MKAMGIIFTNDATLGELTHKRTMASIPFGGRYRQVDFALSNLTIAGIKNIGIISRHNYQSLMNHVGDAEEWGLELGEGGLEFLTPYAMSMSHTYRGKLESLYSSMDFLNYGDEDEYVVTIDSSVACNIDLNEIINSHINSGKDITVVAKAGICNGVRPIDLAVKLNKNGEVADIAVDYEAPSDYLASMDIIVTSKKWLIHQVKEHIAHNLYHLDRDLVLGGWQKGLVSVNVSVFDGVALYNESVAEYYANSMALIDQNIFNDLFNNNHPIYTKVRDRVPSYYGTTCDVSNSIVADGCILDGTVSHSVLFRQVTIKEGASVKDCVIMNDSVIGEGAELQYVVMDKDVIVRPGTKLYGTANSPVIIKRGEIV